MIILYLYNEKNEMFGRVQAFSEDEIMNLLKQVDKKPAKVIYYNSNNGGLKDINEVVPLLENKASYGVCINHCCQTHGCKYGHDDCPVETGQHEGMTGRCQVCWEIGLDYEEEEE